MPETKVRAGGLVYDSGRDRHRYWGGRIEKTQKVGLLKNFTRRSLMSELVLRLDDQLATRLSVVAQEHYGGDPNAVVSDALRLLFLQPIRKDRRKIAHLIDEMRSQVQAAGGVTEKKIDHLIREYRQQKRAGK